MIPALSLCMIVRDEELNLARCLDSVQWIADELLVVDTGSTDRTISIAARYGAKVAPFDFTTVDFAAARNHAIAQARGRWILMIDADETLDPDCVTAVRALVAGDENVGYYFERHNHSGDSEHAATDYVVRLFPNRSHIRYQGRVHE